MIFHFINVFPGENTLKLKLKINENLWVKSYPNEKKVSKIFGQVPDY